MFDASVRSQSAYDQSLRPEGAAPTKATKLNVNDQDPNARAEQPEKRFSLLRPFKKAYLSAITLGKKDLTQVITDTISQRNTSLPGGQAQKDKQKVWLLSQAVQKLNQMGRLDKDALVSFLGDALRYRDTTAVKKLLQYTPQQLKKAALYEIVDKNMGYYSEASQAYIAELFDLKAISDSAADKKNNVLLQAVLIGDFDKAHLLVNNGVDYSDLLQDPSKLNEVVKKAVNADDAEILNYVLTSGSDIDESQLKDAIFNDVREREIYDSYDYGEGGVPNIVEEFKGYESYQVNHPQSEKVFEKYTLMPVFKEAASSLADADNLDEVLVNLQNKLSCDSLEKLEAIVTKQFAQANYGLEDVTGSTRSDRAEDTFQTESLAEETVNPFETEGRQKLYHLYTDTERRNIAQLLGLIQSYNQINEVEE